MQRRSTALPRWFWPLPLIFNRSVALPRSWLASVAGLLLTAGGCWGQLYTISTIAGGVPPPTPVAAVNASIGEPLGVATDAAGNVYIASDNCIFKVDTVRRDDTLRWYV